jgi:hypothetical protein
VPVLRLRHSILAAAFLWSAAAFSQTVTIQLDGGAFKVAGWNAPRTPPAKGWASVFLIYAGSGDVPPLLGSYAVESGSLLFRPRFPLAAGVRYRAVFHAPGSGTVERTFDGPPKDTTRLTRVDRVYPSADILPSNLLRFYIYFSAPMTQGEAGRRVHLLDDKGAVLTGIFLPGEELWDPHFQRLTLTLDPGRIKRGLTSNQSMGPPIVNGRLYTLVIDQDWPDARDVPMVKGFSKPFRGGPEQRTRVDPKQWHETTPKAATLSPLIVDFPRPMNYVLLQRMLQVSRGAAKLDGSPSVDRQETRWLFNPREPWKPGDYSLVVNTALEDLAGNSIALAFDIDVFDRVTQHLEASTISLPFTVR